MPHPTRQRRKTACQPGSRCSSWWAFRHQTGATRSRCTTALTGKQTGSVQGRWFRNDFGRDAQYFTAWLPAFEANNEVEWWVKASCSGACPRPGRRRDGCGLVSDWAARNRRGGAPERGPCGSVPSAAAAAESGSSALGSHHERASHATTEPSGAPHCSPGRRWRLARPSAGCGWPAPGRGERRVRCDGYGASRGAGRGADSRQAPPQ